MLETRHFILIIAAIFLGITGSANGQELAEPAGEQFLVNTYSTDQQRFPSVAKYSGGFVVVWQSTGSSGGDTDGNSVQAQLFSSSGVKLGAEFQVNGYSTGDQAYSGVVTDLDGDFLVIWRSFGSTGSDDSGSSVQGRRFTSAGVSLGTEFQVNSYTPMSQYGASVAMAPSGEFVVVWSSPSDQGDTDLLSVQGQRFDSAGGFLGDQFQINSFTTGSQWGPSVAMTDAGSFVVVWRNSDDRIRGQRFGSNGNPLSTEFEVGGAVAETDRGAIVASLPTGGFLVAWSYLGTDDDDGSAGSVQAQLFASNGAPVGTPFRVNSYTTNDQHAPDAVATSDGDFLVFWESRGSFQRDDAGFSIQMRRFGSDGSPMGNEFQVNSYTTGQQRAAVVGIDSENNFVVAWESRGSWAGDPFGYSVQGRLYRVDAIFSEGFESGDTSKWSLTVQ